MGSRDGSRTAATSKMERFVIIVNDFQPLTIITKHSILDVPAVLDPPLGSQLNIEKEFPIISTILMLENPQKEIKSKFSSLKRTPKTNLNMVYYLRGNCCTSKGSNCTTY